MNILKNKKQLTLEIVKMVFASVIMAFVLVLCERYLLPLLIDPNLYYGRKSIQVLVLLFEAVVGVVSYFTLMIVLRSEDMRDTIRLLRRKQE